MAEKPNILLITADHLDWHTICNRSECKTPRMTRFAEQGISFERSYTPISLCCPARAMLLSGAYPWHNGVFNQVHVPESTHPDMFPDVITYSHRLGDVGYERAYVGKWHASQVRGPEDFGYRVLSVEGRKGDEPRLVDPQYVTWPGGDRFLMWAGVEGAEDDLPEKRLADAAIEGVRDLTEGENPWLFEVHFPQPHDSYTPLLKYLDQYSPEEVELPRSYYEETFEGKPALLEREAEGWAELSEEEFREGLRHYYAYCTQLDVQIGRVLDALDESGRAEDTLVVLACDHGDLVGAHRMFIKGWMPYEETHRIPMAARWPGVIEPGSSTDALVHLHDWAHTFVSLAGAEPLPHAGGKDLSPLLRDPEAAEPEMPDHILNVYYGGELLYTQRIAIGQRYKYVFNGFAQDELYDLQEDPDELHNVIDDEEYAEAVRQTRDALWELMMQHDDPYAQHRYGAPRYLEGHSEGKDLEYRQSKAEDFRGRTWLDRWKWLTEGRD